MSVSTVSKFVKEPSIAEARDHIPGARKHPARRRTPSQTYAKGSKSVICKPSRVLYLRALANGWPEVLDWGHRRRGNTGGAQLGHTYLAVNSSNVSSWLVDASWPS